MQVKLLNITPNAEEHIVEIARVSSSRKNKKDKPEGLLRYLVRHKHWSPFEHGHATFEIETSKAIGIQLIRHRSFSFQEFSQRYQDVNRLGDIFEPIELRSQCEDNRQSSVEIINPKIMMETISPASETIEAFLGKAHSLYNKLLEAGVARETARMVLPLATTTKIHMTGSIRSWIHFLELRDDDHAQKEIQLIAKEIKQQLKLKLPVISEALNF
jgi:thymidylate synthase (FAD)